jgi:hypothetical protein
VRALAACSPIDVLDRAGADYRVVLDAVLLPAARVPGPPTRLRGRSLPYWTKHGVAVRAGGPPVEIAIARAWRDRAGIHWGSPNDPEPVVRFPTCDGEGWLVFAGGFRLSRRRACLPLDVTAGGRRTRVVVGLGRACPRRS